eukprot:gene21631-biopygen14705
MGRGRIAGAPTPDIWGRKAGRGRRLQAYGYAPARQVRESTAGAPPQAFNRAQSVASWRMGSGPCSGGPNPRHIEGVWGRQKASPPGA